MKNTFRDYDNKTYVEFIDPTLYILISTGDQTTIKRVQSKLSESHLAVFCQVISYRTLQILAKLSRNKVYMENPHDFDRLRKLDESKEEVDKLYAEYLVSIEPSVFLEAVSHITYYLAKEILKKQVDIHKELLKSWAQWHVYLTKKNKNKREGEKIKEKLKIILGDKVDDLEKIQLDYTNDIQRTKDGKSHIFINIDDEIRTDDCIVSDILVLPPRLEVLDILVIEEYKKCVEIGDKSYSLRDYYDLVKNNIDKSWLQSNDLLKRIVITYLIKRCQNGDEDAFNKLFGFYKDKAELLALWFIRKKAQYRNKIVFSEGGMLSEDAVRSAVWTILEKLLKGDNPANIYKYLDKDRADKEGVDFLNKRPYKALDEAYGAMFQMINGQYHMLHSFQTELIKSSKDPMHRYKTAKKPETRKQYMQSLFRTCQYYLTRANGTATMFTMLDPLALLSVSSQYNKNLFKPTNKGNLTSWLFGVKGKFRGKLLEALNDWFKKNTTAIDGKRMITEDDYGHTSFNEDDFNDDDLM